MFNNSTWHKKFLFQIDHRYIVMENSKDNPSAKFLCGIKLNESSIFEKPFGTSSNAIPLTF